MKIFLNDDVAATGKSLIFLADEHRVHGRIAPRILCAVAKADEIVIVEVSESVDLV
jgi:hypothetical protein